MWVWGRGLYKVTRQRYPYERDLLYYVGGSTAGRPSIAEKPEYEDGGPGSQVTWNGWNLGMMTSHRRLGCMEKSRYSYWRASWLRYLAIYKGMYNI